jgi:hypothetical protein
MGTVNDRWLTLPETSRRALAEKGLTQPSDQCDPQLAAMMAGQLFACYRASEANDPEMYVAAVAANLARFPEPIVRQVCSPAVGLPTENKWLPSVAEIREACEKLMAPVYAERRRAALLADTAKVLAPLPPATAESRKSVREMADDLRAELNARGEPRKIDFRKPGDAREAEVVRRHFEAKLEELKASADKPLAAPRQRCNDDKIATGEHSRGEIAGDNF